MSGRSPTAYFTQDSLQEFSRRYASLTASLHSLAMEVEQKKFPAKGCREWKHRAAAISSAVKVLIDGKTPPPELIRMGRPKKGELDD